MRKVYITITLVLVGFFNVFGQYPTLEKADQYFSDLSYVKAADMYQKFAYKDTSGHALKRLGDCYYLNANMEQASKWYGMLFSKHKKIESEYYFKYAQSLRGIGKTEASDVWMAKFNKKKKADTRGANFTSSDADFSEINTEDASYTIENLTKINTEYSEFGAMFYGDSIVFSGPQVQGHFIKRSHAYDNKAFLDLYASDPNGDGKVSVKELNTIYHESSVSFSPDNQTVYFTRNNVVGNKRVKGQDGLTNLKLYSAKLIDNIWKDIKELPFNSNSYSVGHPAVSSDGKRLYFVSDMEGSKGYTDIFYVDIKGVDEYGSVQTVPNINTEGREMFPYAVDDKIYFSSDGHFGLGGLDVFVSKQKNTGDNAFGAPVNLKTPINSQSDDFSFVINPETGKGYFASNRDGGQGSDDIYSLTKGIEEEVKEKEPCVQIATGVVRDKYLGTPLASATVSLSHQDGRFVEEIIADEQGKFSFTLPCNSNYRVTASKEYYKPDSDTFSTTEAASVELDLDFNLDIIDEFTYNDRNEIMIKINPIYFDSNKSNIRPDAAKELDFIVSIMERFPKLIIESTSHTDAVGKASYNMSLSERRANSTVRYIISKGISADRITGKGYGESKLTNKCIDNDDHTNRVQCTKEEHQDNRRSEFLILNL